MSLTIDGATYNLPMKVINRTASAVYKYAERVETGDLKSEIIGFWYNFDVEVGQSINNVADYNALWIKLSEAVESHTITMPNGASDLTFSCYFASIKDEVSKQKGGTNYFRNLSFSIIGTSPAVVP
jgi:hypothetical protein